MDSGDLVCVAVCGGDPKTPLALAGGRDAAGAGERGGGLYLALF